MELYLLEGSKTEVRRHSGGRKTSLEAEFLRGRYGFIRRGDRSDVFSLFLSLKLLFARNLNF
ncbi:hypothetical protein PanWU01x14_202540 [Parasponia andersonii]|uniref:Uncharacterized protein n=1 Tax=Parasponia andersonii TaxID=3476 RepID=A0A2P5BX53_PARAD|nr:hypothetical protein PanWU01x14_202540 [Parasponia andersonii]